MTAEEYIDRHSPFGEDISKEVTLEAIDMAKREIAWKVHELICDGKDIQAIDKYVTDITDF